MSSSQEHSLPIIKTSIRPISQASLFQKLRYQILSNVWQQMNRQTLVRPITILLSSLLVVGFVFVMSYAGFRFYIEVMQMPAHGLILELLIGLLFFSLGVLLVFSGGLILHGSLFNTAETAFLLSKPLSADQIFAYKYQGAVGFSSWAFLLMGGPLLIAYVIVAGSPWYFFLFLPAYFLGFILIPGSTGAIFCLLIVNYFPQKRKEVFISLLIFICITLGWWIYHTAQENRRIAFSTEPSSEAATQLLNRISFTRSLWLPSGWVARGLIACSRGELSPTYYYLALIWSNGLMLYLVASWLSYHLYRKGYNRLTTGGDFQKKHGGAWMDRLVSPLFFIFDPKTRLLIIKDFRSFRRDPQQFGQVAVFSGILILYFTNIKRLFIREIEWPFQNGISLLNIFSIALLLSAYTGRFIFPLLSLEGRKFWILGLLPLERDRLIWGKFAFSFLGGSILSVFMILLSDLMLEMPLDVIAIHTLAGLALSAGLSGFSVSLGTLIPNFRESDPSKIAVGFGGTLNLIVGLGYLCLTLSLTVIPWRLFMATLKSAEEPRTLIMITSVIFGIAAGLIISGACVLIPLKMGIQALRKMEF